MQAQFEIHDAAMLDEETASNASPLQRIECVAVKAAEKSTKALLHFDKDKNKLFSKYLASRNLQSS
jgi:pyruvate kinase